MSSTRVTVVSDGDAVARKAALYIAERALAATAEGKGFQLAVSGGHTPWAMLACLAREDLQWTQLDIFQVDERVAPDGDPDRNLTHLLAALGDLGGRVNPMPVTARDLTAAAARYEAMLPKRFDLVHLGLGPDGHTASLVPGDPVLEVRDRDVALTQPYQGHIRMTLTYPGLGRANELLWVVTGPDKAKPLRRLLSGDTDIPAGRLRGEPALVIADAQAAAQLDSNQISST